MELQLNDSYRIRSDSANVILEEWNPGIRGTDDKRGAYKAGDVIGWQPEEFYGTLEGALRGFERRRIRNSDAKGIAEVRALLEEIRAEVARVGDGLCQDTQEGGRGRLQATKLSDPGDSATGTKTARHRAVSRGGRP